MTPAGEPPPASPAASRCTTDNDIIVSGNESVASTSAGCHDEGNPTHADLRVTLQPQADGDVPSGYQTDDAVLQHRQQHSADVVSRSHPCLEHCKTAPLHSSTATQFLGGHQLVFSRCKTDKRDAPKCDSKLDKLSELEKKRIMENLIKIKNDGTVEFDVAQSAPVASELLEIDAADATVPAEMEGDSAKINKSIPKLNIAILVVGTRGDVQPFIAIAKRLQEFGHRVRLATHVNFRNFVKSAGIEFYPLGGDPRIMAGYMAKTKGFLLSGPMEISNQRKQVKAVIYSLLPACTEPDMDSGIPFRAQAIIANPPAYGHAHVAEALGVPLHIFFTMPWT